MWCLISGGVGGKTQPFMIGVAGGTASGKTTVCEKIMEAVNSRADLPPSSGSSSSDEGAGGPNQSKLLHLLTQPFYLAFGPKMSNTSLKGNFAVKSDQKMLRNSLNSSKTWLSSTIGWPCFWWAWLQKSVHRMGGSSGPTMKGFHNINHGLASHPEPKAIK